ncbi:hypothetical protein HID58_013239 [Brassica napus]|uniref:non-specific serine/threonine protein kinase n=1 Tax=Brassica napus TaxID=3708 RepID=A0ABQ8E3E2_BRANA|nr:hypothetical protein HID58_013239 [Brassica napus]
MVGSSASGEASSNTERSLDVIDMRCKVVDFGNACWADKMFAEEIQTRQYRAPEVILKSGYSFSVDMRKIAIGGARSKDYFDRHGDVKRIRRLKYWPLDRLLVDKYKFPEAEAKEFAESYS